jgi:uncharacterized membrane protein YgaE (UPF0421/DUF939 family)
MPFSALFFEWIAYHPIVIGVMLLFFIPTVVMLKATDGVVTSSVIILHIYLANKITIDLFINELGVIVTGIGVALLINVYMPSVDQKLRHFQSRIEGNFKVIFCEMVNYLRTGDSDWSGMEITETAQVLDEAKSMAFLEIENHVLREENDYYYYFRMREKQFEILERVLPIVTSLTVTLPQGKMIAEFLQELSENIQPGNTAHIYLDKLKEMKKEFEEMELPKTREEFEVRAALLQLVKEMNEYLIIKSTFNTTKWNKLRKIEAN